MRAFLLVLIIITLATSPASYSQMMGATSESRELVVGTKVAPPFAMKAEDGSWHGIGIDLWRRIARQTHLNYRFQETTLEGLTDGVVDGSLDAAVAALTVTLPRLRRVDFTLPFYSTGLGIAVADTTSITWWPVVTNIFSLGFLRAVLALFAVPSRSGSCCGLWSVGTTSILARITEALALVFGGPPRR
jgi:polar amino acid transport system substrate-binding protein